MLSKTLLTTVILFTSSTLSAPTGTHCQCKIISTTDSTSPPPASYTPSAAHWTPANPSSDEPVSPIINDICTSLASQLEKFRHTDRELYDLYMRSSPSSSSDSSLAQKPIPTSVLLSSNRKEAMHDYASSPDEPTPEKSRIVCFSAPRLSSQTAAASSLSDFPSSPLALCLLQLIVIFSILACVVEGIHLLRTYIHSLTTLTSSCSTPTPTPTCSPLPAHKSLRLTGSEQRLLAIPTDPYHQLDAAMCCCRSPGAEKKLRAYQEAPTRLFTSVRGAGRREFIAYDDDSDDEVNRPVM